MTTNSKLLESLVQNYPFKKDKPGKHPTIDYVYPDCTAYGNTEAFRFYKELRQELAARADSVSESLNGKMRAYSFDDALLLEIDQISPRLGLKELVNGEINSIYGCPLLYIGADETNFVAYVIKPVIDSTMAWFELTKEETQKVYSLLKNKAEQKPYKTLFQRLFRISQHKPEASK